MSKMKTSRLCIAQQVKNNCRTKASTPPCQSSPQTNSFKQIDTL